MVGTINAGNTGNMSNPGNAGNTGNMGNASNAGNTGNMNNLLGANEKVHTQMTQREQMLMMVQAYEFALVEVGLFLDTHPTDQTALAYFKQYRELKHRAEAEFTRMYGPITMDHMDNDLSTWRWIENPWPWEIGSGV